MYYNLSTLDQFENSNKTVVDATFPSNSIWKQVLLINVVKDGKSSTPMMALMSTKTYDEYSKIGDRLQEILRENNIRFKTEIYISYDS